MNVSKDPSMHGLIFKITPSDAWEKACIAGVFTGAPVDLADGYIHFSTAGQAAETLRKHFAGQTDLLLIAVDSSALGNALKWEVSRGGALFPHLYEPLSISHVVWERPIGVDANGNHVLPNLET
ncbi:MAG: DUF952 domain-containing protein [Pseudomonadota bacterium]